MQTADSRTVVFELSDTPTQKRASLGAGRKHWINLAIGELKTGEMFTVDGDEMSDSRIRIYAVKWSKEYGFKISVRAIQRGNVRVYKIIRLE